MTEPTRDGCVLMADANKSQYFVEALIDSGSAINLMTESTYLDFFKNYDLIKMNEVNYGGINKSLLIIYGYIILKVRLKLLPDHFFTIRFCVVPDTTMTYSSLLGHQFICQPRLTVMLGKTIELNYQEPIMESILNIEVMENVTKVDTVCSDLSDYSF